MNMNRTSSNEGVESNGLNSAHGKLEERTVATPDVDIGEVRLPRELLRRLGIEEGGIVRVEHEEKVTLLRAYVGVLPWAESNPEDLTGIGARSGTRISYTVEKTPQKS
jgi:hypothetical protein